MDDDLRGDLEKAWATALSGIKPPEPSPFSMADGTYYIHSGYIGLGLNENPRGRLLYPSISGSSHSPQPNTVAGKMAHLSYLLRQYVTDDAGTEAITREMREVCVVIFADQPSVGLPAVRPENPVAPM